MDRRSLEADPISLDIPPNSTGDGADSVLKRQHVHLPKLDEFGFVDWNPEANTVEAGVRFEEIRPALELLRNNRETLPVDSS
ncbi:hypothetical protein C489_07240 [Natrinema versiforme JCM 10478]|uniref:Uncharacterized protein n=1 Tax=Natrinema versiforme JCM 10478 TaxID=1227496 RepID=L9Y446_9EURY|nr:hypothetical protein [Natrinema versiforme]ELY68477.1 hypothetical protein C489_07240 [Natrinema versiforme JCM 10478]